jgi:DNA-binding winged helix-turn-helix (wHTH) protein
MADVSKPTRQPLRFSSFELDLLSGELRKAGVLVSLQEQSLKVLTGLLDRPGDLVTREQLRQRLWPDGTFVDYEHGLNAVINRLRETLGDSADVPRFIQTVPRRGCRFIAPVEGAAATPGGESASHVTIAGPKPGRTDAMPARTGRATAIAVAVLLLVVAAVVYRRSPSTSSAPLRLSPLTRLAGLESGPAINNAARREEPSDLP